MKKLSTVAKILALAMTICVLFSLVSCFGGKLKLESFVVDGASIKTTYNVGDEVDFSGIKAYAKYSDESLNKTYTFAELTLTYDKDLTATAGKKTLVVSFMDPNLNVEQKCNVEITVTDGTADPTEPQIVVGFQSPANVISFNGKNKDGALEYGAPGFSGEFAKGGFTYLIGDDNAFKFLPEIDTDLATLSAFYANVEMFVLDGEEYVALTKKATDAKVAAFYLGETLIADVNTYENTYDFTDAAIGKQVKISVMPSEEYYIIDDDTHAVVLEAKIIDAYNVTEAWQLAVIDNSTSDWADIKNAKGIATLTVAGIVLHNDIKVTAADVPASFLYTTEKDVIYTNATNNTTTVVPAGTKYLVDGTNVYNRTGAGDFTIAGNFFTLDVSEFPLVPSPGVFGKDLKDIHYGSDFSNATLIRFETAAGAAATPDDTAVVAIDNISLIGNAKRDNLVDSEQALASAGGLIFLKSSWYTDITVNNTIGNSFFITYFGDYGGDIFANDVKCYDSYQNAAMAWADSTLSFKNSYLNGCGGPVVIVQSVVDENKHPTFVTENTVVETQVTGEEIWFNAINAGAIISPIKALGAGLEKAGLGNFVNKDGKMNITALLMKDGSDATAVIANPYTQGSVNIDGYGIERWIGNNDTEWVSKVLTSPTFGGGAPILSTVDANGKTHYVAGVPNDAYNENDPASLPFFFVDPTTMSAPSAEAAMAFMTAEYITLSQGGISVVFELYHAAN